MEVGFVRVPDFDSVYPLTRSTINTSAVTFHRLHRHLLSNTAIEELGDRTRQIYPGISCGFQDLCCQTCDVKAWKSTEYHQFLSYICRACLLNLLPVEICEHFIVSCHLIWALVHFLYVDFYSFLLVKCLDFTILRASFELSTIWPIQLTMSRFMKLYTKSLFPRMGLIWI